MILEIRAGREAPKPYALRMRAGKPGGGGKGPLIQEDVSGTLGCGNDQTIFQPVAFSIGAYFSEGMLSDNPKAGIKQTETARTLDQAGGNPTSQQDSVCIVCLQGAVVGRADTAGPGGKGWRSDGVAYTVDTKAPSVICMDTQQGGAEIAIDLSPTITSAAGTSGNNQPAVCLLNDHGGGC